MANTWVSPIGKLYKKDAKDYNFDPSKAKALFAAAGWKPGPDGILAKDGKKMSLNFSTTAGNKLRERVQQILQAQWKAVGVDVNIQNFPATVVFSGDFAPRSAEGKWDLFMYAWSNDPSLERGDLWARRTFPAKKRLRWTELLQLQRRRLRQALEDGQNRVRSERPRQTL